jgi:hypothetical protein
LGRPARAVSAEIVRELTTADLALLGGDRGVRSPSVKRLTDMHRSIARLVAQGEAGYAIAMTTGYSESRISILKSDPAFQELVARFREEVDEVRATSFVDTQAKLVALTNDTIEAMHDRVLDEDLPIRDLTDIAKFAADRSGFGPASKSLNANLNIDLADQLAVGRQRADELNAAIPAAKANRLPSPDRLASRDRTDE